MEIENKKNQDNEPGPILNCVRVRFMGQTQACTFLMGNLPIKYGQKVVAMSERGMAIGYVNSYPFVLPYSETMQNLLTINKVAEEGDVAKYKQIYHEQKKARNTFNRLISEYQLEMNLSDFQFTSDGNKVIFYYTASNRIDFRELLKALNIALKVRVELRQIRIRESGPAISRVGPCGPDQCLFINSLMLNKKPGKIGCNEFYCCLDYKDPFYEDKRDRLPRVGDFITTHSGEMGRVEKLDLWHEEFELLTDQGILKRYVSEHRHETLDKKTVVFPKYFETITKENKIVVRLKEADASTLNAMEIDNQKSQETVKAFSDENFALLFEHLALAELLPQAECNSQKIQDKTIVNSKEKV
jgi:cell fate regulator YaaT (PSP1 superfamily)